MKELNERIEDLADRFRDAKSAYEILSDWRTVDFIKEVCIEVAAASLGKAAENATIICKSSWHETEFDNLVLNEGEDHEETITVFKDSITSPDNIVTL